MSAQIEKVLAEALDLSPTERAELIEELLQSFEKPLRRETHARWCREAEERIDAYDNGEMKARPASEVFERLDGLSKP